ncbi:formyltransferase family protein [Nonomuraea sp. NPDC049646]|uniref:formyltransferase family protein n=1 Tax=unclassified Nonomuraea TaxID=2593643 RepID=UPI0037B7A5AA
MSLNVYVSGQRAFGAAVADLVINEGHHLVGAASPAYAPPDHPVADAFGHPDMRHDLLRQAAYRHHAPWTEAARLNATHIPDSTDVIVAAHSHTFLGRRTRARARLAAIGYHPSLLPLHRGRDAVRWTIRDGDRVTGGSVYHLTDAVDGGPLAAQDYVLVPPGSTPRTLWREHLFPLGLHLLARVLADIDAGTVAYVPQDEACATWEPSWQRPRLHRPELAELPPPGPAGGLRYVADPALARARTSRRATYGAAVP